MRLFAAGEAAHIQTPVSRLDHMGWGISHSSPRFVGSLTLAVSPTRLFWRQDFYVRLLKATYNMFDIGLWASCELFHLIFLQHYELATIIMLILQMRVLRFREIK